MERNSKYLSTYWRITLATGGRRQKHQSMGSLLGHRTKPNTGVIFDQALRFKSHVVNKRHQRSNTYVRQLFKAVVAPHTDYPAIVWRRPKDDGSTTRGTQMRKLTTIQ